MCFSAGSCLGGCTFDGVGKRALILWGESARAWPGAFRAAIFLPRVPEAAWTSRYRATEAQQRAKDFGKAGENLDGYQSTITFEVDDTPKLIWNANSDCRSQSADVFRA